MSQRDVVHPVVQTTSGLVRGRADRRGATFKGIPYAAAPIGALRWRRPRPPKPWAGIVDAGEFGAIAPQVKSLGITLAPGSVQNEDCLSLNVFAPADCPGSSPRPVMVWIHGGAYFMGASSQKLYGGASFVKTGEVLVVTVNYRIGALGFLDLSSFSTQTERFDSNVALADVLLALEWVRDNIAAFGGDPGQVTVFGESAGAGIITALLTIEPARGLFQRAIVESSPATSVYNSERAAGVARMFIHEAGLNRHDAEALRSISVADIVAAGAKVFARVPLEAPGTLAFAPVVDNDLVCEYPLAVFRRGGQHPIPLLIGTNKDEASLFTLMKAPLVPIRADTIAAMFGVIAQEHPDLTVPTMATLAPAYQGLSPKAMGLGIARDVAFRMPTIWLAEAHSRIAPVWLYRFDFAPPVLKLLGIGATHGTELPYVWNRLLNSAKEVLYRFGGIRTGRRLSARMQHRWRSFAVSAEPRGLPGEPAWPPYAEPARATLVIDRTDTVVEDLDKDLRTAWGDEVLGFT